MKKLLTLLTLLTLSIATYSIDTHVRFGGVTNARIYSGNEAFDEFAPAIGLEVTQSLLLFDVGAGIQYNNGVTALDIETMPAYLLARWNFFPFGIKPYAVVKAGKSIYTKNKISGYDNEAKYFYGAGVGVNISFLQGEVLYSRTELDGRRKYNYMDQVSVMLGYRL